MPVNIDHSFSVYHLIERIQKHSDVISQRKTMNIISYEIENATLKDGERTRIFSGFQRMSKFLPQVNRYRQMAKTAESIYVFGIPDIQPPQIENIHYINLEPTDQLSKEWFIVSYGESYSSTLATEELSHIDMPDSQRQFKGIWTFNVTLTAILEGWLTRTVDAPPLMIDEERHNFMRHKQVIRNTMQRLDNRSLRKQDIVLKTLVEGELDIIVGRHQ